MIFNTRTKKVFLFSISLLFVCGFFFQPFMLSVRENSGTLTLALHTRNAEAGVVDGIVSGFKDGLLALPLNVNKILLEFVILPIAAFVNYVAGIIFDSAIAFSLDTSQFQSGSPLGGAIREAWVVIRDVGNMLFIFVLLYIAISTILRIGSYQMKQMLPRVIIAAVLINFSLFFSQVVIDAGNILAHGFYNAVRAGCDTPPEPQALGGGGPTVSGAPQESISFCIMGGLLIQTAWDQSGWKWTGLNEGLNLIINQFMRLALTLTTAGIFIMVSFMFVTRIIAFVFLMTTSPIGFIGPVLPGIDGLAKKWWRTLFEQSMLAPVFLIFMYMIRKIIDSGAFQSYGPLSTKSIDIKLAFNFVILIGLIIAAYKITKHLAGEIGGLAVKWGTALTAGALAIGTGGAGLAMRFGVGGIASKVASSQGLKNTAIKGSSVLSRGAARFTLGAANLAKKDSFDLRDSKAFGFIAKKTGLDAGARTFGLDLTRGAGKGGFDEWAKKRKEKEQEGADIYKTTDEEAAANLKALNNAENNKKDIEEQVHNDQKKKMEEAEKPLVEEIKKNTEAQTKLGGELSGLKAERMAKLEAGEAPGVQLESDIQDKEDQLQNLGKSRGDLDKKLDGVREAARRSVMTVEEAIKVGEEAAKSQIELKKRLEAERGGHEAEIARLQSELKTAPGAERRNEIRAKIEEGQEKIKGGTTRIQENDAEILKIKEGWMGNVPEKLRAANERLEVIKRASKDRRDIIAERIEAGKTLRSFFRTKATNRGIAQAIRDDAKKGGYKKKGGKDKFHEELKKYLKEEGELKDEGEDTPETPPPPGSSPFGGGQPPPYNPPPPPTFRFPPPSGGGKPPPASGSVGVRVGP